MEMDCIHQYHLDDAQKKLSAFRNQLDRLMRDVCESNNVSPQDILTAVNQLQSLVEWVAQQSAHGAENTLLIVKLQELQNIRKNLEISRSEVENYNILNLNEEQGNNTCKRDENNSEGLLDFSDHVTTSGDAEERSSILSISESCFQEAESSPIVDVGNSVFITEGDIKIDTLERIISDDLISKEANETNLDTREQSSDRINSHILQNTIVIKDMFSDDIDLFVKSDEETSCLVPETSNLKKENLILTNVKAPSQNVTKNENFYSNNLHLLKFNEEKDLLSNGIFKGITVQNLIQSDLSLKISHKETKNLLSIDSEINEIQDSILNSSELIENSNSESKNIQDEDIALRRTNTLMQMLPSNNLTQNTSQIDLLVKDIGLGASKSLRGDVIILETNEDDKTTEWIGDSTNDSFGTCMFAIQNLYDSLRTKENELLKLSVMQNDQKHIDALQKVIVDFHKNVTYLKNKLDESNKENSLLKEQVLELEEAENDARLESQKLEQKFLFLQEKDSHSQSEICQLRLTLNESSEKLVERELAVKEISSQVKYLESLVLKYEDQIKLMEAKELSQCEKEEHYLRQLQITQEIVKKRKPIFADKGTQTYPLQTKLTDITKLQEYCGGEKWDIDKTEATNFNTQVLNTIINSNSSTSASAKTNIRAENGFSEIVSISQEESMERLPKLISEDAVLQQELHHVDQINFDIWKNLQKSENNIDEYERKDATDITLNTNEISEIQDTSLDAKMDESNTAIHIDRISGMDPNAFAQNDQYINDRISKLENTNISFEKELKTRETICKEKEEKYIEWMETERRLMCELKCMANEKDTLMNQVENLKEEKELLEDRELKLQAELNTFKDKNQKEIIKIRTDQELLAKELHLQVNHLITKEKDLLKRITRLKSERSTKQDKGELERLKSNYIELQLELSNSRDDIRKLEDGFQNRLDECVSKHLSEESYLTTQLDCLRNKKSRCHQMITDLQTKQNDLLQKLERQKNELMPTTECYRRSLEETEKVHQSVETGLKSQLQIMEEVAVIATRALREERAKVEKDLQGNINDLRAKEELYKSRIAELELDVKHLHEELHKAMEEFEPRLDMTVLANSTRNDNLKIKDKATSPTISYDLQTDAQTLHHSQPLKSSSPPLSIVDCSQMVNGIQVFETELKIRTDVDTSKTQANKLQLTTNDMRPKQGISEEVINYDNVYKLRFQEVKENLEQISSETTVISPTITAPSMGLQKEELDYAEVDECTDDWRKTNEIFMSQNCYGDQYTKKYRSNCSDEKTSVDDFYEENDYDEVLPRPTNFHIVQEVGPDTLLVGWNYVNPSVLDGFEVHLNDEVHERIYMPDRTKALISGLNFRKPIHLRIYALSRYGQISEPAVLEVSRHAERNIKEVENEEDECQNLEDSLIKNIRPYSMEW